MSYGTQGQLGIVRQNSTAVIGSSFNYLPILSENLDHQIDENIPGDFTRFGKLQPPPEQGFQRVIGPVELEPVPETIGHIFRGFFNVASSEADDDSFIHKFFAGVEDEDFDEVLALPPYTVEVFKGVGSAWNIADAQISQLTFTQEPGAFLRTSINLFGRFLTINSKGTAAYEAGPPWAWDQASISLGGVAQGGIFEGFEIALDNKAEGINTIPGSVWFGLSKRTDFFTVDVSGTVSFDNDAEYNIFRAGTQQRLMATYINPDLETGSGFFATMILDVPQLRYTTFPLGLTGPGRQSISFSGKGVVDTTSNYAFEVTLVNTVASY